ncbi:MAG: alginate lyase family protein [Paraglaciecola sp.]|uniref:Alginate lyase family protein n=1 Tax=Alishewanella maricola TaxID=2795740 RepID=A0ABS8C7J3_9ALTE|nr:alginate lyase family protein [Alishewanella maricola]MCB5228317.1 alginate lyase family protein [Alishewanella maricola]MDP5133954.1 alginate lyase family protein [Paraglaciecola sp.]
MNVIFSTALSCMMFFLAFICHAQQDAELLAKTYLNEPIRLSESALQQTKLRAKQGDIRTLSAIAFLDKAATELLSVPIFTIVNKSILPASGNKHDYFSFGPYWWPDPTKADGKPWVKIDGKINPASREPEQDKVAFKQFSDAVTTLATAYFFTDKPEYAQKTATLIKAWFLDEATYMNPHLNYAQAIPGITDGRGIGIIDMWYLYRVIDGIRLIQSSAALSDVDNRKLQQWFSTYLDWLINSPLGIEERNTHNNHATFYALQTAIVAFYVGKHDIAHQQVKHATKLLKQQVEKDGQQPHELSRTRPFHYSVFNLQAFVGLAAIAPKVGLDLWNHPQAESPTIKAAIEYILTRTKSSQNWNGKQERQIELFRLIPVLPDLARAYDIPASEYQDILDAYPTTSAQCALLFGLPQPIAASTSEFSLCAY